MWQKWEQKSSNTNVSPPSCPCPCPTGPTNPTGCFWPPHPSNIPSLSPPQPLLPLYPDVDFSFYYLISLVPAPVFLYLLTWLFDAPPPHPPQPPKSYQPHTAWRKGAGKTSSSPEFSEQGELTRSRRLMNTVEGMHAFGTLFQSPQ